MGLAYYSGDMMVITIRNLVVGAVSAIIAGGTVFATEAPQQEQAASTRRMAERLEEIAANVDPAKHPYVNLDRVEYFRDQLERQQRLAETNGSKNKDPILKARFALAKELLYAGQSKASVQQLKQLQTAVDNPHIQHIIQAQLGLAYLRLGEQENCILQHTIESCLLPIGGGGVHQLQDGSRAAVGEFLEVLSRKPKDLTARWLINIAYMTLGEYPEQVPPQYLIPPEVFKSDYDIKPFRDVASRLGLDTMGLSGGAIMEDFDGDGYLDIMASSKGMRDQIRYFGNNGDGTFTDHTEGAGLMGIVGGLNLTHADYDNNGYADVLALRGAWLNDRGHYPNSLLTNRGDGRFVDTTEEAGLLTLHPTQAAAWGDFDNDGWVDLFVGNESLGTEIHRCELFHNQADGTFVDVAQQTGVAVQGFVKAVAWGDYNNDGQLDLYVSRILPTQPNFLFRNEGEDEAGHWRFTDVTAEAGVPGPDFSFPTWFWDYNNDGWLDIFVAAFNGSAADVAADYLGMPHSADEPRLYRNNGDGRFTDVTVEAKLNEPLLAMGCNFGDLDNDGYLDCYIGTGDPEMSTLVPNRMFRNAAGRFFQDVTTSGGFGHLQKGHGVAFGDIDHDGDQDVFSVMGGAYTGDAFQDVLFENPGHGNHWIKLKLEGTRSNRAAMGARIKVSVDTANGVREIYGMVTSGGCFGGSSFQQEIGLGQATAIRFIEITWPASGEVQVFNNVDMDQILHIREGDSLPVVFEFKSFDLSPDNGAQGQTHTHHGGH